MRIGQRNLIRIEPESHRTGNYYMSWGKITGEIINFPNRLGQPQPFNHDFEGERERSALFATPQVSATGIISVCADRSRSINWYIPNAIVEI